MNDDVKQLVSRFQMLKQNYFVNKGQTDAVVEAMLNTLSEALASSEEENLELQKKIAELEQQLKDKIQT